MNRVFNLMPAAGQRYNLRFLKALGLFIALMAIWVVLLVIPPSADITRRIYESGVQMILFISVVFSFLFGWRSSFWVWSGLLFTFVLFGLSLIYKWHGLGENYFLIGGLLPWSDSYGYYDEAQRLLHGLNLTAWGARRPLFPAFLSVFLALTNNNLQLVLIIFVLLNALAVYLAAQEVRVTLKSPAAAAIYVVISFLFYRRFAGTVMTENLGFLLGNLAMVFLLQGVRENNIKKLYGGLFVLTVALNARAGAFFVLPVLAVWMAYFLRHKFVWWRVFAGAGCLIFLGMASNVLLLKLIGPADGAVPFSNFSYTFYGLAAGNQGWSQVIRDYPNAKDEEVPALALAKFKENPYMLVVGITRAYRGFTTSSQGSFSFLWVPTQQREFASLLLWMLTIMGLIFAMVKGKRHPYLSIVLACFLGILFSVSLLPPIDSDKMRVYAATIPMTIYLISLGVSVPGLIYRNYSGGQQADVENEKVFSVQPLAASFSIILLCMLFVGPLLVKQMGGFPNTVEKNSCVPGNEQVHFLMGSGSSVSLVADAVVQESYLPLLRVSDFQKISRIHDQELKDVLLSQRGGSTLNLGVRIDLPNGEKNIRSTFLISPYIMKPGYYDLCLVASKSELLQIYPLYDYDPQVLTTSDESTWRLSESTIHKVRFWYAGGLWVLFVLFILDLVQIWKFPLKTVPFVLVNTLVVNIGLLMLLHCLGLVPLQWQTVALNVEDAKHVRNFSYLLDLKNTWINSSGVWNYPVKLYENDVELNHSDKVLSLIASEGEGRFLITRGNLYFSSSDNSAPQENERKYKIVWPTPVRIRYQWITYILAVAGLLIHRKYFRPYILSGHV